MVRNKQLLEPTRKVYDCVADEEHDIFEDGHGGLAEESDDFPREWFRGLGAGHVIEIAEDIAGITLLVRTCILFSKVFFDVAFVASLLDDKNPWLGLGHDSYPPELLYRHLSGIKNRSDFFFWFHGSLVVVECWKHSNPFLWEERVYMILTDFFPEGLNLLTVVHPWVASFYNYNIMTAVGIHSLNILGFFLLLLVPDSQWEHPFCLRWSMASESPTHWFVPLAYYLQS